MNTLEYKPRKFDLKLIYIVINITMNKYQELCESSEEGDLEKIKEINSEYPILIERFYFIILIDAICIDDLDVFKYMIENGYGKNELEKWIEECCISSKSDKILKYLHSQGVNIAHNIDSNFILCCRKGNLDAAKYLHEQGANVRHDGDKAMEFAVTKGRIELVEWLHEHGADVRMKNDRCLFLAIRNYHLELAEWLMKKDCDLKNQELELLNIFCEQDACLTMIKWLIKHGADITAKNNEILRRACEHGQLEMAKYLVKHGADIKACNNLRIFHPRMYGFNRQTFQWLQEHGCRVYYYQNDERKLFWCVQAMRL